jgi:hypothetical protein
VKTDFAFVHAKSGEDDEERLAVRSTFKAVTRRTAQLAEAGQLLDTLPGPGESLHVLMTGRYDLMHVLVLLLERQAPRGPCRLRIATLSYNARNVTELLAQIDAGRIGQLTFLCSKFFRENDTEIYVLLQKELQERNPDGRHRLAASRNHAKVVTFHWADGTCYALEGSANLRSNSNQEQYALINDRGLHDFHASWIEELVSRYEGNESRDPTKG